MYKILSNKKIVACISSVAALSLVCTCAYALRPSAKLTAFASAEETADRVKVFIGDVDRAPESYMQQRNAYIKDTATTKANVSIDAVIGLDSYYTVDEVTEWAENYDITLKHVYMWPQGETGRLGLNVENGSIDSAIKKYMGWVEDNDICENDPTFAADYQRFLDGEYEVFALTVTATAETLEALSTGADCVSYVDVMYNAEAERYAERASKAVSYVELPSKPDGAL